MMPIHEKIRLFRQVKGWTQEEIADKLDLSVNGYGEIERGNSDIKLSRLEQIAGLLGVELVDLLGTTERNVFNQSYNNSTGDQNNHNYTENGQAELQMEIERQSLMIQLKDKEIELRDERIRHLEEVNELLKSRDSI